MMLEGCWKDEFINPDCIHFAPGGLDIGALFSHHCLLSGQYVPANGEVENATHSSATARPDATPAPSSIPNGALSNFSSAPEFLLNDELWGDLGLGLSDNWDVAGTSMNWMD
jgi:hypothetical protein